MSVFLAEHENTVALPVAMTLPFFQVFDEITKLVLAMKKNKLAQANPAITSTNITVKKGDGGKKKGKCNCG